MKAGTLYLTRALFVIPAMLLLIGCGAARPDAIVPTPAPLDAGNVNLIFVVSQDIAYQAAGEVNPATANLTSQGLHRSLLMGTFLKQRVLGNANVSGIFALAPMTHLQTASNYPDMSALATIQHFAMLNQITMTYPLGVGATTGNNYPINASYALESVPSGVVQPSASLTCPGCQGLDFKDQGGVNEDLVTGIVRANVPGFYVFSAPWETMHSLMGNINALEHYGLTLPAKYQGPNYVYAISITPPASANLVTYNSNLKPSAMYPALPSPVPVSGACTMQTPFRITATGAPATINKNETLYIVRHANAHPSASFSDGDYVAAGQWRALDLPNVLRGKINPTHVYSLDPAQIAPGTYSALGNSYSHATLAMTVEPYAIANNLPYSLVSNFLLSDPDAPQLASNFFFQGSQFSNQTFLLAWEHTNIPLTVNALLSSYGSAQTAPGWPALDYDTIWTVKLDSSGNLTVDNSLCEGIDSDTLPAAAPEF